MADLPKRVWSGKKQVYSGKKPVWVKDGKLGVYDPNFKEVTNGQYYSPNRWGNVSSNAELQIYDDKDSLNPTDIGTFEDGLSSTYQFVDWDGTVLKSGTVKDGETPVAPTNPTREHYTFTGWNPTVGPINKNTTYSAVYAIDTFTPVASFVSNSQVPDNFVVAEGGVTTITIDYLPVNANDFSHVTFEPYDTAEDTSYPGMANFSIVSYENGTATVSVTGTAEGVLLYQMYIDGVANDLFINGDIAAPL